MTSQIANRNFLLGRESERERILALLEAELPRVTGCGCCLDADLSPAELIAIIKGDKNA